LLLVIIAAAVLLLALAFATGADVEIIAATA
jgi:hypothetical protein